MTEMEEKKMIPLATRFQMGRRSFTIEENIRVRKSWFRGKDAGRSLGIGLTGSCFLLRAFSFSCL